MKIRSGFVSNSSSSSFIVIGNKSKVIPNHTSIITVPDDFRGKLDFGWEVEDSFDFGSKLNFTYLQSQYLYDREIDSLLKQALEVTQGHSNIQLKMIEDVLKEEMNVKEIVWNFTKGEYGEINEGYIDHQSAASEGSNIEMFESKDALARFLFCPDSKIHTCNDNA